MFTFKGVTSTKQACCEALSDDMSWVDITFVLGERLFCVITLLEVKIIMFHRHMKILTTLL